MSVAERPSPTVARVLRGDLCTGCGLCASLGGEPMVRTTGFQRPRQIPNVTLAQEATIAASCPGSKVAPWPKKTPVMHPFWGPMLDLRTGHATDEKLRHRASSGGVISALLVHAIGSGLVDKVVAIEADRDQPTANLTRVARTAEEIFSTAGSRYAPSSPLETIDAMLDGAERIAFVGKPCDVSALRQFATLDPRVDEKVPLMLSFFCAGVPNLAASSRVLAAMGVGREEVRAFRYRGEGWPGFAAATLEDKSERTMSYAESWGGYLSKDVQSRCKICPDAVGGVADVVCADAWYGGETGYPDFSELPGRSLVASRTQRGEQLLRSAVKAGAISLDEAALDPAQVDLMQPSQARRKRVVRARVAALRVAGRPVPVMTGTMVAEASREAPVREQLHQFLGMVKRLVVSTRRVSRR